MTEVKPLKGSRLQYNIDHQRDEGGGDEAETRSCGDRLSCHVCATIVLARYVRSRKGKKKEAPRRERRREEAR